MDRLWAPWRMGYIKKPKEKGCLLCRIIREKKDDKNFVLLRSKTTVSVLNIYPYNNGHIMVIPKRHLNSLEKLKSQEVEDIFFHIKQVIIILKKVLKPQGFNIGLNLGQVAGAGISSHLHIHIVPRWRGDTNFMPILSNTKVIPQSLEKTYKKIKKYL